VLLVDIELPASRIHFYVVLAFFYNISAAYVRSQLSSQEGMLADAKVLSASNKVAESAWTLRFLCICDIKLRFRATTSGRLALASHSASYGAIVFASCHA
jgi:hypothetical protein